MSSLYAPGASFFSVYPHLSFLTMPTRSGLPVTGKASQNIKMYSRSRVIRNRSSRHHGMKQQHQVLLQQRHLLVVREPSGVGPFGGALDPRLLRLVPLRQNKGRDRGRSLVCGSRRGTAFGSHLQPVVRLLGVQLLLLALRLALGAKAKETVGRLHVHRERGLLHRTVAAPPVGGQVLHTRSPYTP